MIDPVSAFAVATTAWTISKAVAVGQENENDQLGKRSLQPLTSNWTSTSGVPYSKKYSGREVEAGHICGS